MQVPISKQTIIQLIRNIYFLFLIYKYSYIYLSVYIIVKYYLDYYFILLEEFILIYSLQNKQCIDNRNHISKKICISLSINEYFNNN